MRAKAFPEATHTLRSSRTNLSDMPIYSDGHTCVSIFEVTDEDLKILAETRKLYLTICHPPNDYFPPLTIGTENPIPPVHLIKP